MNTQPQPQPKPHERPLTEEERRKVEAATIGETIRGRVMIAKGRRLP